MDLATSVSGEPISKSVSRAEGLDSRFSRYKSQALSEETQNVLRYVLSEVAVTSKSDGVTGLRMDRIRQIFCKSPGGLVSKTDYLAPPPRRRTVFHGYQIVHWDPLNAKQRCPKKIGMGYVKMHGFHGNL